MPLHKINVISYGEEKPVAPNKTKDGRAAEPPRRHQGAHLDARHAAESCLPSRVPRAGRLVGGRGTSRRQRVALCIRHAAFAATLLQPLGPTSSPITDSQGASRCDRVSAVSCAAAASVLADLALSGGSLSRRRARRSASARRLQHGSQRRALGRRRAAIHSAVRSAPGCRRRTALELSLDVRTETQRRPDRARHATCPSRRRCCCFPPAARSRPIVLGGAGWYFQRVESCSTATWSNPRPPASSAGTAASAPSSALGRHVGVHADYRYTFLHFGDDDDDEDDIRAERLPSRLTTARCGRLG